MLSLSRYITVATADGPCVLGDVLLTVGLWIEAEQITLDGAHKVEYAPDETTAIESSSPRADAERTTAVSQCRFPKILRTSPISNGRRLV